MRIKILHQTTFAFAPMSRATLLALRLTPMSFESQYIYHWRVDIDVDGALRRDRDAFGNRTHSLTYHKPVERLTVTAEGEAECSDAVGVVRGETETLPTEMYLRGSPLTAMSAGLRDFVSSAAGQASDPLDALHRLMGAIHTDIAFEADAAPAQGGAAEALAMKRAGAADFAHILIAAARSLEIPARIVSGYVASGETHHTGVMDVWAEAYAPKLGWVAFDPTRDLCANDAYVRVAVGLDYPGVEPIRISHTGAIESRSGLLTIEDANRLGASQE